MSQAAVDTALQRVFEMRFKLGEFDSPGRVAYQSIPVSVIGDPDSLAAALDAARQSITLLANSESVLPLSLATKPRLAVIGPHGNDTAVMMGGKNDYYPYFTIPIARGLTDLGLTVDLHAGCDVSPRREETTMFARALN